ncbi:MAG: hypothetical protein E7395_00070 [Ruminococcaceae bacterium]|nr:hypothetical protein [Oscillospiraceae bacterium]
MKKIISLLLTLSLIICVPASVYAEDTVSVSILTPANGITIENTECTVELDTNGNIDETVIELDGTRIDGNVLTESMLTIGEHTLAVYVIGADGSVASDTSIFNVQKSIVNAKFTQNFNDMANGYVADASTIILYGDYNFKTADYRITFATRWKAKPDAYYGRVSAASGPDGDTDYAANITSEVGSTKGATSLPSINVQLGSSVGVKTSGSFEFDLKINPSTYIIFNAIGVSSAFLKNDNTLRLFDNYSVTSGGVILGDSEKTYDPSKWQHVKITLEPTSTCTKFKLEMSEKDAQGNWVVHTTVTDTTTASIGERVDGFRIYYGGGAGMGLSLDNVKVSEAPTYTGINKITYMYDTEESTDKYPDVTKLTALKLYMNEKLTASDLTGMVEITDSNNVVIPASALEVDAANNAIIASVSQKLDVNAAYKVLVDLSANYPGTVLETDKSHITFKTAADSYDVTGIDYSVGSTRLITAAQLKGKKLSATVHFSNSEIDVQRVTVVLAVRSGKKLVGLDIVSAAIPETTANCDVPLETDIIPNDITKAQIQVMLLDNMSTRQPVFATYEVNY